MLAQYLIISSPPVKFMVDFSSCPIPSPDKFIIIEKEIKCSQYFWSFMASQFFGGHERGSWSWACCLVGSCWYLNSCALSKLRFLPFHLQVKPKNGGEKWGGRPDEWFQSSNGVCNHYFHRVRYTWEWLFPPSLRCSNKEESKREGAAILQFGHSKSHEKLEPYEPPEGASVLR